MINIKNRKRIFTSISLATMLLMSTHTAFAFNETFTTNKSLGDTETIEVTTGSSSRSNNVKSENRKSERKNSFEDKEVTFGDGNELGDIFVNTNTSNSNNIPEKEVTKPVKEVTKPVKEVTKPVKEVTKEVVGTKGDSSNQIVPEDFDKFDEFESIGETNPSKPTNPVKPAPDNKPQINAQIDSNTSTGSVIGGFDGSFSGFSTNNSNNNPNSVITPDSNGVFDFGGTITGNVLDNTSGIIDAEQFQILGYEDSVIIVDTEDTVQYTIDNRVEYPIFNDTGIKIGKDKLIKFTDAKNILQQIAIRKDTKFAEDTNKAIILVDGKVVIVKEEDKINLDLISRQFENTNTDLLAKKSRMGGKFNLADYVELRKDLTIRVDGVEKKLTTNPIVDNSHVLLPIRDIAVSLDAKVDWNKDKKEAIISKEGKKMTFNKDSSIVTLNGVKYDLSNPARVNNDRLLTLTKFLAKELGATIEWNAKDLILEITKSVE